MLAQQYQTEALTAHGERSWLWAEAFALTLDLTAVDHELLYVAAMPHDVGLVTEYENHTIAYEDAGGHVAVALAAGAGWPIERRQRVREVIVRHNWPSVVPALDVDRHLLEIATGLDILGARADAPPEQFLRGVLDVHPRGELAYEFAACVTDQANRKPTTAARRLVDTDVAVSLAENPLERLQ